MRLAEKVVVVTGGSRGIGRAIVTKCHTEGAQVISLDIDPSQETSYAVSYSGSERAPLPLTCDVTDGGMIEDAIAETLRRFGRVDVLVNNAGVNAYFDAAAMTEADWDGFMALDLKACWLCAKHVLPLMRAAGDGVIVNIASVHAQVTTPGMFPYAAAKAGIVGLTRCLALDEGKHGIRVNAVCPGWTRTELVQEWFDRRPDPIAAEAAVLRLHPLGRIGTPEDVANLVAFLASDDATFISGASLTVDGAFTAQFPT